MMQLGPEGNFCEFVNKDSSVIGSSVTGTIVSLLIGIKKVSLYLIRLSVTRDAGYLYAFFDYGFTKEMVKAFYFRYER